MQVEAQIQVQFEVQGEAPPLPPILPISLKAGLIGICIGGWGDEPKREIFLVDQHILKLNICFYR